MKKFIAGIFLLFLFSCGKGTQVASDLLSFVPPKTAVILKNNDLNEFSEKLSSNSLIAQNLDLSLAGYFSEQLKNIKKLKLEGENLLCFTKIGRKKVATTLITQTQPHYTQKDSAQQKVEYFEYDGQEVAKHLLDNEKVYSVQLGKVFIMSSAKLVLENVIRAYNNQHLPSKELKKIYEAASGSSASLLLHNDYFQEMLHEFSPNRNSSFLNNFTDWTVVDLQIEENSIQFTGVSATAGKQAKLIDVFSNSQAQANEIANITPLNATGFYSFGIDNFLEFQDKLFAFSKKENPNSKNEALFSSAQEIGAIYAKNKTAIVLNSIETSTTEDALSASREAINEFRNVPIYKFNSPDSFQQNLSPLIQTNNLTYYTLIDHFFVFAQEQQTLENIIANYQNRTVLANRNYYNDITKNLSDESSILLVGINKNFVDEIVAEAVAEEYKKELQESKLSDYKISALQLIYEQDFAHVNAIVKKIENASTTSSGGTQLRSIKVEEPIATTPKYVTNWRNKQRDIAVQGESNTLYVYNHKGNLRWKKELDGRIIGDIQQIDIYNNGRLQLIFATPNKVYIFDKDGNTVSPFPLAFEKTITQPLSVFDYANNSKYRFVVTQGKNLTMYNKEGKTVSGFTFNKTKNEISTAPKHIRIGTKDYILVTEKSGKLNILNRTGSTRIPVDQTFDLSKNDWYLYNNQFTSTNKNGNLIQISESGKISTQNLQLSEDHQIDATAKTLVSLSENKLSIKGKQVELDYGLYTAPTIFYLNNKIYITLTDTQSSKVYVFDSNANLLPGFPAYGNSAIDIDNMDNIGKLECVVKGEDNSLLLYQLN